MSKNSLRVAWLLASRQIRHANIWTTLLIIFVMMLTFLNLVVVSGILVGLIEGAVQAVNTHYVGDVFVSNLRERNYIERSQEIIATAQTLPGVKTVTGRYLEGGTIEANYTQTKRRPGDKGEEVSTSFVGIDPATENDFSQLSSLIVEGEYLAPGDYDQVILGGLLLQKYLQFESPTFPVLKEVAIGDRLRITIAGNTREVWVKGITRSKVDEIDRRVFMVDTQFRNLIGRTDYNVDEIAIRIEPPTDPVGIKQALITAGFDRGAVIQTQEEAEPKFLKDIKQTFAILGTAISSIGLLVSSITVFIVVFVNAITRRKYIGILKGIGVRAGAIELSYVFQSLVYAISGSFLAIISVYAILVPFFNAHPIDFPFSDGILVAPLPGTLVRLAVLIAATLVAGYLPAWLVIRRNTLDSILGR